MKLQKNKVIKDIPEKLVSFYINLGWKEVKEKKEEKEVIKEDKNVENFKETFYK